MLLQCCGVSVAVAVGGSSVVASVDGFSVLVVVVAVDGVSVVVVVVCSG